MNKDILSRNIFLLENFKSLEKDFLDKNINIMLLKGSALLELNISSIYQREMSDIDILIEKEKLNDLILTLKKNNFIKMPNSFYAYYKNIKESFPPLIIDIHFSLKYLDDINLFWENSKEIRPNIFVPSLEHLIILNITHSIFNHGFFDEKSQYDIKNIFLKTQNKNELLNNTLKIAKKEKVLKIISLALEKTKIKENIKIKLSLKEFLLLPLIKLSFKKYFSFNEYLLFFLYKPKKGIKLLFPNKHLIQERYNKYSFKIYFYRLFNIFLHIFNFKGKD